MTEEELIKSLPEPVKENAQRLLRMKPEELPEHPEKNKWYYYSPKGCICSNGFPYYSSLKLGTENNLIVLFCGGGCALDAYSAARPNTYFPQEGKSQFYFADTFIAGYLLAHTGIADKDRDDNPFRNWSVVVIAYGSGDFHCGTNDFAYDDPEMGAGICHHHGYNNYRAMVEKIKEYVPNPGKLLVTGFSAGGFGTAILTDDVMSLFPNCKDVTCIEDSGVFSYGGWYETAKAQWGTPKEILARIHSDNIVLDCLLALHRKYGKKVKIAFGCTYRDALLSQCEGYTHGQGGLIFSRENGDIFEQTLARFVKTLKDEIPDVALYIFDKPSPEKNVSEKDNLTDHTFITSPDVFDYSYGGVKLIDWITNTVNGKPMQVGLELLGVK